MEEAQMAAPTPSRLNALKAEAILPHFVRRSAAQQFLLAEMPKDLREALADYDVDGDGTVTVGEIAAGAVLLRQQKKKNALMLKAVVGLFTLLILQLGAITGLVFTVVKAMQQTSVSAASPVMTVKGSTTAVQTANSDFYVDPATGLFRTRTPAGSTSGSARHLLQDEDPTARIASADFNLQSSGLLMSSNVFAQPSLYAALSAVDASELGSNSSSSSGSGRHLLASGVPTLASGVGDELRSAPTTVLPPVCDWASSDLFNLDSCDTTTATGVVSLSDKRATTKPYYSQCDTMQGACSNFAFASQVAVPMWGQSYGNGGYDLASGRMSSVSMTITSMARVGLAKRVAASPCYNELYRMYTNADLSSWVDLCITPYPNHYWQDDKYCEGCPVGPFLDYTNLKYDNNLFDLPCKPGFRVPKVTYDQGKTSKTMPTNSCYLSLNFVNDPIYAFEKQFPSVATAACNSPIQCSANSGGTGRHLLLKASDPPSGTGITPSDLRLKKNIVPTGRLVSSLLPEYTWQWNDVAKALHLDGYPTVGVLAQEAQALFPAAVSTAADGYLRVDYGML